MQNSEWCKEWVQKGVEGMQIAEKVQNSCTTDAKPVQTAKWVPNAKGEQNSCRTDADQMQNTKLMQKGCRKGADWDKLFFVLPSSVPKDGGSEQIEVKRFFMRSLKP